MRSSVRPRWRGVSRYLGIRAGIGVVSHVGHAVEPRARLMTQVAGSSPLRLDGASRPGARSSAG